MASEENPRLTPELEATLRRYVTGGLDEALRGELEERLVTEPPVFEALGVVEDELVEEYLDGLGTPAERQAFEQGFLTSPRRVERLRFAKALRARAGVLGDRRGRERGASDPRRRVAWIGLAAALLLSLSGNLWQAMRPHDSTATFRLGASRLRAASGSIVTVETDKPVIRLVLSLAGARHSAYRLSVVDDDGRERWTAARVVPPAGEAGEEIELLLPSKLLARGDYEVRLSGLGPGDEPTLLATFVFRVTGSAEGGP
jgi:hypothetical protein